MGDNVIPLRPTPTDGRGGLLGLPSCPVQHCRACGLKTGWRWVSRDWGCSECATVDDLSMRLVGAHQTIDELRERLVFCDECSSAPGESCTDENHSARLHVHDVRLRSTSASTKGEP